MTQSEIAKQLGVSQAAVSYVLKGRGRVSSDLKRKVMDLMANDPSPLRRQRQGSVLLFYSGDMVWKRNDIRESRFGDAVSQMVQEELLSAGRHCQSYVDLRMESLLNRPPEHLVEDVESGRISSIIAVNLTWRRETWSWLSKLGVPVIGFDHDFGWGSVSFDMLQAGFDAGRLLLEKGCSKIELLCSSTCEWIDSSVADKINRPLRAGLANALREKSVRAPECWLTPDMLPPGLLRDAETGIPPELGGYELFNILYKMRKPDGVLVYTDIFALGVQKAIDELGLEIGKDLQVVLLSNKESSFPGNERFMNLKMSARKMAQEFVSLAFAAERGEAPREAYLRFE